MRMVTAIGGILALVAALVMPATAQGVNVTGKWVFDVQTGGGSGQPTVTFKQDGEKLTGHYSSQTLGEADFTGHGEGQRHPVHVQCGGAGPADRRGVLRNRGRQHDEGHRQHGRRPVDRVVHGQEAVGQGSGIRGQGSGIRGQGSGIRGQGSGVSESRAL